MDKYLTVKNSERMRDIDSMLWGAIEITEEEKNFYNAHLEIMKSDITKAYENAKDEYDNWINYKPLK